MKSVNVTEKLQTMVKQQNGMKKKYGVRTGSPFKKEDAQIIGEFIDNVKDKTPIGILDEIKNNTDHVIHDYIEWNDEIASTEFRLSQVRNIVNHITIEIVKVNSNKVPIRAFYSVRKETNGKTPVYVDVKTAFSKDYYREQVIERAFSELKNWRERYNHLYKELRGVFSAIEPFVSD